MTAVGVLRLDRTPPVLTWGPVVDAIASETMTVQYLLNEGAITSAELHVAGPRVIPVDIHPGVLTVELPDDTPEGIGQLQVVTTDDVGNSLAYALDIPIVGMVVGPPPSYTPVPRVGGVPLPPERVVHRSSAVAVTHERITVRRTERVVARTGGRESIARRLVAGRVVGVIETTWRTETRQTAAVAMAVGSGDAVAKTAESRQHEDELILAGIL